MGSDIAHDDAEEPFRDGPGRDTERRGEEHVESSLSARSPGDDREMSRSEELTVIREALEALEDVQTVMNERIDLLGREVDDIWMALRDDR